MNCVKLESAGYLNVETGEVVDAEAIEALEMERDKKIRNIACWIRNLESDESALCEQIKIFTARKNAVKNKKESLKGYLARYLDGKSWQNDEVKINWRKSEVIEVDEGLDYKKIPAVYVDYGEPKLDKNLLKADIKAGLDIKGIHIVQKNNIIVK